MNWILTFGFIFGAVLGSFIKVLADRSLRKVSFGGRSYCESCKHQLHWYDLFPILSFLSLKGKCRYCKKSIPLEYVAIEVLMGLLVVLLFSIAVPKNFLTLTQVQLSILIPDLIFKAFTISVLIVTFLTDIKKGIIPDRITYPAVVISFFYLVIITIYKILLLYRSLSTNPLGKFLLPPYSDFFVRHAIDIAAPFYLGLFAALLLIIFFGGIIFLTKGRGMGGGDLKLGIFMGLVLGFPNILVALMISFVTGSLIGVVLLIARKKHFGQTIPFGPFLTLGGITAIFWGDKILNWYLNLHI